MRAVGWDYKLDVADVQKEFNAGRESDVKSFAPSTLPTLQDHLRQAEQVESKVMRALGRGKAPRGSSRRRGVTGP
jgi:putative membrane protein